MRKLRAGVCVAFIFVIPSVRAAGHGSIIFDPVFVGKQEAAGVWVLWSWAILGAGVSNDFGCYYGIMDEIWVMAQREIWVLRCGSGVLGASENWSLGASSKCSFIWVQLQVGSSLSPIHFWVLRIGRLWVLQSTKGTGRSLTRCSASACLNRSPSIPRALRGCVGYVLFANDCC